ncbi:hypothetical protein [Eremococcus coleocola]|uniref:DUF7973 domain-containing protein n=1 Tax=Eremococcus coleocola ACS-139-V-Col8 TaxID=908337 RepID=E4KQY0_9LACT|nr:hypothetical protein [Eremococcus coleocola]EFR30813.1 hypothetical protein HMPREF9257_0690 [Eremococcus coleocola ACS-139-V-Col8]
MDLLSLILAFFGGVFGAAIGAIPAIGLCGFFVLVGSAIMVATGSDAFLNDVAFGYFFGPHIAFTGAVAATAYLGSKEIGGFKGTDIDRAPFGVQEPMALLVGGCFAVIGYLSAYLITNVLGIQADGGAVGIVVGSIITRLVFGKQSLLSPVENGQSRLAISGKEIIFGILWSAAYAAVIAYVTSVTNVPFFGFGFGAFLFFFTIFGADFPVGHHVGLLAGLAMAHFNNYAIAIIFGVVAWAVFELVARGLNTNTKTHIDPPGYAIALLTFVLNTFF